MLRFSNVLRNRSFSTKVELKSLLDRMAAQNAKKVYTKDAPKVTGMFGKTADSASPSGTSSLADALNKFKLDATKGGSSRGFVPPSSPTSSIRDSFRKVEAQREAINREARSQQQQGRPSVTPQTIRDDVLKNAKETSSGSAIQDEEGVVEYTDGEIRYDKLQQKIHLKRERRAEELQPEIISYGTQPRYDPDAPVEPPAPDPNRLKTGLNGVVDFAELKRQLQMKVQAQKGSLPTDQQQKEAETKKNKKSKTKNLGSYQELLAMRQSQKSSDEPQEAKEVVIPAEGIFLKDLSTLLGKKVEKLGKVLDRMGETVGRAEVKQKKKGSRAKRKVNAIVDDVFVDPDVAEIVALDYGFKVVREVDEITAAETKPSGEAATIGEGGGGAAVLLPRAPIVCVMGHVDHGKTTLLDGLRNLNVENQIAAQSSGEKTKGSKKNSSTKKTAAASAADGEGPELISVAAGEAGGITQKLSAFGVTLADERRAVFLDTPGHAAFSAMRAYGALATDLVVLVVAMDDGVRPQTIEAIKTAQEANCNIIIALNKVDKFRNSEERQRARERVLTQLVEHGLVAEEFGGKCEVVEVSGKSGENLPDLVDSIMLQADVMELTAAREGQAEAVVLDAHLDRGVGVVAEVLVKWGSLSVGDAIVVGNAHGRVRSMTNDRVESVEVAYPSDSVRMTGLKSVPSNGQEMLSVASETKARLIAERRKQRFEARKAAEEERIRENKMAQEAAALAAAASASPEELDKDGKPLVAKKVVVPVVPQVKVILKADGTGTVEALTQIVKGVASRTTDVTVNILHSGVGAVSQADVNMADVSGDCEILAFNVGVLDSHTRALAKECEVNIETSDIVYRLEEALIKKMGKMMPVEKVYAREGTARLLKVFQLNNKGKSVVAGLQVTSGKMKVTGQHTFNFRVIRDGKVVIDAYDGEVELKRFKDVVHEVENGLECGLNLGKFSDLKEGDEIECLKVEHKQKQLHISSGVSGAMHSSSKKFDVHARRK